jgi:hypothetical protein
VPGSAGDQDQTVAADQQAVAAVQASHPDLLIAETGDASILRAIDNSLNFGQAEATSPPSRCWASAPGTPLYGCAVPCAAAPFGPAPDRVAPESSRSWRHLRAASSQPKIPPGMSTFG